MTCCDADEDEYNGSGVEVSVFWWLPLILEVDNERKGGSLKRAGVDVRLGLNERRVICFSNKKINQIIVKLNISKTYFIPLFPVLICVYSKNLFCRWDFGPVFGLNVVFPYRG